MVTAFARLAAYSMLIALAVLQGPCAFSAQDPQAAVAVAGVHAGIATMGRKWNPEVMAETARLYAALHSQRDATALRRTGDISYGADVAQKLDLFVPDQGFNELGPVLIFLHDSDATGRDKIVAGTDQLLYSNVAKAMARAGGVGINANYRLSVKAMSPDGADDIRQLIEWTRKNVAGHGGDPEAIIVMGHGEGALRLASYLFRQASQPAGLPGIAGAVLAEGSFDSPALWKMLDGYRGKAVPMLLWTAEYDPIESGVVALKDRLCSKQGVCPMLAELKGHNRVSAVMSLDSADVSAMGSIVRFYHSAVRK